MVQSLIIDINNSMNNGNRIISKNARVENHSHICENITFVGLGDIFQTKWYFLLTIDDFQLCDYELEIFLATCTFL